MRAIALAVITVMTFSSTLPAQDLGVMYSNNVFQQSVIGMGSATLAPGADTPSGQPTVADAMTAASARAFAAPPPAEVSTGPRLEFHRDPARSAQFARALADSLQIDDPALAQAVRDNLRNGNLLDSYDAVMASRGLSPTHLGDVISAWLLLSWEIVNGVDTTGNTAGHHRVRLQAHQIGESQFIAEMDDALKQQIAETLSYMTLFTAGGNGGDQDNRGAADRAASADRLNTMVKDQFGIDLREIALTPEGLVLQ